jgi:hypothetical protein
MALAKGSKSKLVWAQEDTFGTLKSGAASTGLLFSSETLVEQIDTLTSEDIRSDRATPSVRGGNIASGGNITCDFALQRAFPWLTLLTAGTVDQTAAPNVALTDAKAVSRGDLFTVTAADAKVHYYVALTAGTYNKVGATIAADFAGLVAKGTKTIGGINWMWVGHTTVYKYTITGGTDMTTGLSLEKQVLGGTADNYTAFMGGKINSLELTLPQKGIVKANWALLFMKTQAAAATQMNPASITYPTDDPVTGYDSAITVGTLGARPIREGSLSINNNIDAETYILGSRTREDLVEGRRSLSARVTSFFKDRGEYDLFLQETVVPVTFSFAHANDYLSITFAEAKLTGSGTPQVSGAGLITSSYDITGFKQDETNDLTVTMYSSTDDLA